MLSNGLRQKPNKRNQTSDNHHNVPIPKWKLSTSWSIAAVVGCDFSNVSICSGCLNFPSFFLLFPGEIRSYCSPAGSSSSENSDNQPHTLILNLLIIWQMLPHNSESIKTKFKAVALCKTKNVLFNIDCNTERTLSNIRI